jgi:hypothetical protein
MKVGSCGRLTIVTADAFDQLALIAEISATFLGFIAVFLILSDKEGRFHESDKHFVQALVLTAAYTIILALTPGALSFIMAGDVLWTSSLGIAAALGMASAVFQARVQLKMTPEEAAKIHPGWHFAAWGISFIALSLIIAGLLGFADPVGMLIGTLSLGVFLALLLFIACHLVFFLRYCCL